MAEMIATRDGFGNEIVELGKTNDKILVFSGDLEDATRAEYFKKAYPTRFFNLGITEQDVVGTAAGASTLGFVTFATSFAVFLTNRAYDQIRMDVCYNNCNVKVVCSHAGLTVGEDGASAQCLEDLAIMRVLPNMRVLCPVDNVEVRKATRAIVAEKGPIYMRTSRAPLPVITSESDPFIIGKANVMRAGKDVTFIACGIMVSESLSAAEILKAEGIDARVINMHTIKPIDKDTIIAAAKETGAIVTAEEHQIHGGLGSAVVEVLAQFAPVPVEMVAVKDSFGESGTPAELMKAYHLKDVDIVQAARKVIKRKK
ncbi:MAG: transketolase family protein [Candidatus Omnitrophica bacterium]|nr:transketolase family protein [Candidatus Omnitrophota bacterium]